METLPKLMAPQPLSSEACSTDASHSAIGRTTALDYNLAGIHKNAVIIVNRTVAVGPTLRFPVQVVQDE
jgi:hypothetical protein